MGVDGRLTGFHRTQLGAQRFDVGVDGAIQAFFRLRPNAFHQLLPREHPSGRQQQSLQQQVFVTGQRQRPLMVGDSGRVFVERESAEMVAGALLQALLLIQAAQNGAHPCANLARENGLAT